jgi:hypothetical protein
MGVPYSIRGGCGYGLLIGVYTIRSRGLSSIIGSIFFLITLFHAMSNGSAKDVMMEK